MVKWSAVSRVKSPVDAVLTVPFEGLRVETPAATAWAVTERLPDSQARCAEPLPASIEEGGEVKFKRAGAAPAPRAAPAVTASRPPVMMGPAASREIPPAAV